jgi:hypothetical protein
MPKVYYKVTYDDIREPYSVFYMEDGKTFVQLRLGR